MSQYLPNLIVITGATAVGKTDVCIQIAEILGTEIISADSRQFYKELSIGTAKPDASQLSRVKHHFINSHNITDLYGAGHFERDALVLLEKLFQNHQQVVLTGGSGMYIKALLEGMDDYPEVPLDVREQITTLYQEKGLEWLQKRLLELDPVFMATTDKNNVQRLIRALEIAEYTGQPMSHYKKGSTRHRPFTSTIISLERDRSDLYHRINTRVDTMIESGLVDEVKQLIPFRAHNALQTVGYKELFSYLDGDYTLDEAIYKIKQHTRNYAKRQLTWVRHQLEAQSFHPDELTTILNYIKTKNELAP